VSVKKPHSADPVAVMRDVVALVFNHSVNGLLADPDTEFWKFAFESLDEHGGPDHDGPTWPCSPAPRRT
jgi:hypothetical protein